MSLRNGESMPLTTASHFDRRIDLNSVIATGSPPEVNSSNGVSNCGDGTTSSTINRAVDDGGSIWDQTSALVYLSSWVWVVYIIIGVLGVVGNSLVALVMLRFTNMRQRVTNIYVINQSLLDITVSMFLLLSTLFQDEFLPPGLAGELKCRLWLTKMPFWSAMLSSALNLVAITLERYMKIVHPIIHHVSFTKRKAVASVLLIWVLGYVYVIMPNVMTSAIYKGKCLTLVFWPSDSARKGESVVHFIVQYLLPLMIFVFCYTRMALKLSRGKFQPSVAPAPAATSSSNQKQQDSKHIQNFQKQKNVENNATSSKKGANNILKTMFIVSFAYALCLSPDQWLWFCFNMNMLSFDIFSSSLESCTVIILYLNCFINPIIYAVTYQQFRDAVRQIFLKFKVTVEPTSGVAGMNLDLEGTAKKQELVDRKMTSTTITDVLLSSQTIELLDSNHSTVNIDTSKATPTIIS